MTPCKILCKYVQNADIDTCDPVSLGERPAIPLIKKVISPSRFYGPPRPQPQEERTTPPVPTPPPPIINIRPVQRPPQMPAAEKLEVERQRVAISRAASRKMRVPTSKMGPGDFFATVNVDNVTEQTARCAS